MVGGGRPLVTDEPLAWSVSAVVSVVGGGRPLVTDEPLAWSVSAVVSVVGGGRPLVTDEPLAWSVVFRPYFSAAKTHSDTVSEWVLVMVDQFSSTTASPLETYSSLNHFAPSTWCRMNPIFAACSRSEFDPFARNATTTPRPSNSGVLRS